MKLLKLADTKNVAKSQTVFSLLFQGDSAVDIHNACTVEVVEEDAELAEEAPFVIDLRDAQDLLDFLMNNHDQPAYNSMSDNVRQIGELLQRLTITAPRASNGLIQICSQ
jgi:hypothetical protein